MVRKRRRKTTKRRNKRSRSTKWLTGILLVLVLLMVGYVGHHLYQRHLQQEIIEKQQHSKQLFIKAIAPEAQAMQNQYHIKASITMAQAILESNWGTSKLASQYHNLFGIKGTGANSRLMTTKEYTKGKWVVIKDRFKVYSSWSASIKDHTQLMLNGTQYKKENYQKVIDAKNYREAAQALQDANYATDPNYASKLISVIKTYHLDKYDN
ncbi:glycoside hydrolase family 73 protein [Limosilactobacillus caecicola]|uniref:glycoside hydrolase family 73 protein n=1 Tax=Limosilactobacillus caecicola TaxID=2941332 RepID=UPI00203ECF92|nr:glycoside hydrolase family 73 protein [Limosilactobacillus caecicola]